MTSFMLLLLTVHRLYPFAIVDYMLINSNNSLNIVTHSVVFVQQCIYER